MQGRADRPIVVSLNAEGNLMPNPVRQAAAEVVLASLAKCWQGFFASGYDGAMVQRPETSTTHPAVRAFLIVWLTLPLLPLCGFVLNGLPEVVFYLGATAFIIGVLLPVWMVGTVSMPPAGSPPIAKRFHFTIRDLLCLTTVLFGMTMFFVSAFKCEAAERASRPVPLPAVAFRQFIWEQESGLVCITIGGLVWIRSALKHTKK